VCLEKAFDGNGWRAKQRLPVPKELGEASIVLLVHPTRAQAEIDKTCEVIRDVLAQAIA
jgi:dTDP-4-amino-4,6-dideoxygalactose transaminase